MALTFMLANNSVTKNVKLLPLHLRTGESALLNLPQTTRLALFIDSTGSETLRKEGKRPYFNDIKPLILRLKKMSQCMFTSQF